jgi:uncharacterized protein YceK
MKKIALLLFVLLVMSGCAAEEPTKSIGVIPYGQDTYKTYAYTKLNDDADKHAITEANKHCESLGKHFMSVQANGDTQNFTLVFMCLDQDDPAFEKP